MDGPSTSTIRVKHALSRKGASSSIGSGRPLGRATYEPGWRWSEHVGAELGQRSCPVEHVGLVLSGQAAVKMDDGTERVMKAGDFFYVPPGHDSWVVGDEPYVSLHIVGSEGYAT
jgi:quercetin dioxygenase-like cupin family protein